MKLIFNIVKIVLLLVFLLIAVSNTQTVEFSYLPGQPLALPLIIVMFGALLIGVLLGMFALFGRLLHLRGENNRLRAEVKKLAHAKPEAAPQTAPAEAAQAAAKE